MIKLEVDEYGRRNYLSSLVLAISMVIVTVVAPKFDCRSDSIAAVVNGLDSCYLSAGIKMTMIQKLGCHVLN